MRDLLFSSTNMAAMTSRENLLYAKILKRELNERASIYIHFELKNIAIDEKKFPLLA